MTAPVPDITFVDESRDIGDSSDIMASPPTSTAVASSEAKYPPAILNVSKEYIDECKRWLDGQLQTLIAAQQPNMTKWAREEEAYRAKSSGFQRMPYVGACNDTIPVIAMAADPIHARLDISTFKQDRVFQFKALKKSFVKYNEALSTWIQFYQQHKLKLKQVASPRLLEAIKLGTCFFKTVYDRQVAPIMTYDNDNGDWKVTQKTEVRFSGPRVFGISIGDLLFHPLYQHLQDCPIIAERQRTTLLKLRVAEASKKIQDVEDIKNFTAHSRTELEDAHQKASNHQDALRDHDEIVVYECWFDYDINGDNLPEHLVATYHYDSHTLLQLRYNYYFHQRKPYTSLPYQITNDSIYGLGLCEMVQVFQDAVTKWHRMATDNTYLANIRMFIVKKNSGIEEVPRLYAGRCFFVDSPKDDFIPFASSDMYPSTLAERQNLFGLAEKRTGVSDYLTGRESPIIGSRATATSTIALIQEGTKRVEEVLENIRVALSEIIENCIYIWIQYGLEGLDELVFGDDETGALVKEFFAQTRAENVNGALAIDLAATDAAGNRQAIQQMQLMIIQVMMTYLEKLLAAGQGALAAQATQPQLTAMIADVMTAARKMFRDLLQKYDIRNPDDYLPDLEKYLNGGQVQGAAPGGIGAPTGAPGQPGLLPPPQAFRGPPVPGPATPGSGNGASPSIPLPGLGNGTPAGY